MPRSALLSLYVSTLAAEYLNLPMKAIAVSFLLISIALLPKDVYAFESCDHRGLTSFKSRRPYAQMVLRGSSIFAEGE